MQKRYSKPALIMIWSLVIGKILLLMKDMALARTFGASFISDSYIVAQTIPIVLFSALASALMICFSRVYNSAETDNNQNKVMSNVLNISLLTGVIITALGFIFNDQLAGLFAYGFDEQALGILSSMSKVAVFTILPMAVIAVTKGFLQSKNKFGMLGLEGLIITASMFFGIMLSSMDSYGALAPSILVGYILVALLMLFASFLVGFRYQPVLNMNSDNIKALRSMMWPVFIGLFVLQLNQLVDKTLASTLAEGTITSMYFARSLMLIIVEVVFFIVSSLIYPSLCRSYDRNEEGVFKNIAASSVEVLTMILIPASVLLIAFASPFTKLLFQHGYFTSASAAIASRSLMAYGVGILPMALTLILNNVFYAMKDSKTPALVSVIIVLVNVALSFTFIERYDHLALASATSVAYMVGAVALLVILRARVGSVGLRNLAVNAIKLVLAGIPVSLVGVVLYSIGYHSFPATMTNMLIWIALSLGVCILLYYVLIKFLNVDGTHYIKVYRDKFKSMMRIRVKRPRKSVAAYNPVPIPFEGYEDFFDLTNKYDAFATEDYYAVYDEESLVQLFDEFDEEAESVAVEAEKAAAFEEVQSADGIVALKGSGLDEADVKSVEVQSDTEELLSLRETLKALDKASEEAVVVDEKSDAEVQDAFAERPVIYIEPVQPDENASVDEAAEDVFDVVASDEAVQPKAVKGFAAQLHARVARMSLTLTEKVKNEPKAYDEKEMSESAAKEAAEPETKSSDNKAEVWAPVVLEPVEHKKESLAENAAAGNTKGFKSVFNKTRKATRAKVDKFMSIPNDGVFDNDDEE